MKDQWDAPPPLLDQNKTRRWNKTLRSMKDAPAVTVIRTPKAMDLQLKLRDRLGCRSFRSMTASDFRFAARLLREEECRQMDEQDAAVLREQVAILEVALERKIAELERVQNGHTT